MRFLLWLDIGSRRYKRRVYIPRIIATGSLPSRSRDEGRSFTISEEEGGKKKGRKEEERLTIRFERPSYQIGCTDDVWIELRDDKNGRFDVVKISVEVWCFILLPLFFFFYFRSHSIAIEIRGKVFFYWSFFLFVSECWSLNAWIFFLNGKSMRMR